MLTARQESLLSGFSYQIFNTANQGIAAVRWPLHPQAKNARLKVHSEDSPLGNIEIDFKGKSYPISFEYLSRDWNNDIRFSLYDGENLLALAEVIKSAKRLKNVEIRVLYPFVGEIIRGRALLGIRYEVEVKGNIVGVVAEPKRISFKRELMIDLPDSITPTVQLFFFFLVCNDAFR